MIRYILFFILLFSKQSPLFASPDSLVHHKDVPLETNHATYSYFTGYPGDSAYKEEVFVYVDSIRQTIRKTLRNVSLEFLAKEVYRLDLNTLNSKQEVPTVVFEFGTLDSSVLNSLFTYEIQMQFNTENQLNKRIRHDILGYLKSYVGVTVYSEKRKVHVMDKTVDDLVLVVSDRTFLQPQIGPIAIGQRVSDDFWERKHVRFENERLDTVDFSSLKGKFILLDFWNINCAPCIQSFPILKNIQALYKDKIEVIAVNDQDSFETVVGFYAQNLKKRNLDDMPTLIKDEYLSNLFHKSGYPHYVWIAPGGNVIMQTFSIHFITDEMVQKIMNMKGFFPN